MKQTQRTDPHRVGAIIPADYDYCFSFSLATTVDGWPVPSINIDLVVELRQRGVFANIHPTNQCDVCGAHFIHGDVWKHTPSGQYITLGHICADKYELYADRAEWKRIRGSEIAKVERRAKRIMVHEKMRETLKDTPGLGKALKVDHYITQDIRASFIQWGTLTKKQIEVVFKIEREKQERASEVWVEAQVDETARQTVEGEIISTKHEDTIYGPSVKMLVKIEHEGGYWKTWGTLPQSLWYEKDEQGIETFTDPKGKRIRFTAKLKRSDRDQSFSFFSRPTKASYID